MKRKNVEKALAKLQKAQEMGGSVMKTIYGCYFYNMYLTHWFDTVQEAKEYGYRAGFQYIIIEGKYNVNTVE